MAFIRTTVSITHTAAINYICGYAHGFYLLILKLKYMECPICNKELTCIDYFGRILNHQDGHVEGDIYQCQNEECEGYQEHYHTHRNNPDDLHEGYPC